MPNLWLCLRKATVMHLSIKGRGDFVPWLTLVTCLPIIQANASKISAVVYEQWERRTEGSV